MSAAGMRAGHPPVAVWRRPFIAALLLLLGMALLAAPALAADEGTIFTLWPLVDYRSAPAENFSSLGLAGPLLRHERAGKRTRFGLRPLYYHETNDDGSTEGDLLYPLATFRSGEQESSLAVLQLLTVDRSAEEGKGAMLFPFLFYHDPPQGEGYFALFPLGGKILNRFGRERITFALFPLYGKTERKGTETTNVLWPIFSLIRGENESGWAFWPLFGTAEKHGVYRRSFFLWPIFFRADERLDTTDPLHVRAVFPLYHAADAPGRTEHSFLWPFFSHIEDFRNDFEEWNFPWPLFRIIDGRDRQMLRLLPFYSDDREVKGRSRWFLWPLYKEEERTTASFASQRQRVLYFLYSNRSEQLAGDAAPQSRRTDLWPLFSFEKKDGISRFSALALLEPFFPENVQIERNWSPLWRIYQRRWDETGNTASTLLWNLYWQERRGDALVFELFPLLFYRNEGETRPFEFAVLKGLYRYKAQDEQSCSYFFYLPWGICRTERKDMPPVKESP